MSNRFVTIVPGLHPVGGVRKALDYALHAAATGLTPLISSGGDPDEQSPLLEERSYARLAEVVERLEHLEIATTDIVLFTWPPQFRRLGDFSLDGSKESQQHHRRRQCTSN